MRVQEEQIKVARDHFKLQLSLGNRSPLGALMNGPPTQDAHADNFHFASRPSHSTSSTSYLPHIHQEIFKLIVQILFKFIFCEFSKTFEAFASRQTGECRFLFRSQPVFLSGPVRSSKLYSPISTSSKCSKTCSAWTGTVNQPSD